MWTDIALKILIGLGVKILTERFVGRAIVHSLRALSNKTSNSIDDSMVDDLADALGQPDLKKATPPPAA